MSKNNDINKLKIINQAIKDTEYITTEYSPYRGIISSSKDASIYFLLIFAFTNILHLSSTFLYLSANHLVCFKEVDQEIPL